MKSSNTNFKFDIPVQCHEDWNIMQEKGNGKYCSSCEKTVVDFSKMSDREMADYFQNTAGNVCGRIQKSRLHHPVANERPKRWGHTFKTLGLLLSGLLAGGDVNGQETENHKQINCNAPQFDIDDYGLGFVTMNYENRIWGRVKDEQGKPLGGVHILPKAPVLGTTTDPFGNFEVTIPADLSKPVTLEITLDGHEKLEITPKENERGNLQVVLKKSE